MLIIKYTVGMLNCYSSLGSVLISSKITISPPPTDYTNLYKLVYGDIRDVSYQTLLTSYSTGNGSGNLDYYRLFDYATGTYTTASFASDSSSNVLFTKTSAKVQPMSLFLNPSTNTLTLTGKQYRQMLFLPPIERTVTSYYFTYSMWVYHLTDGYPKTIMVWHTNTPYNGLTTYENVAFIEPRPPGSIKVQSTAISATTFSASSVAKNKWTHYVFTISNVATKLYVDGVSVGTWTSSHSTGMLYPVTLASWDIDAYLKAYMSEIRLYNRELTATEVSNIYKYTEPEPITVPILNNKIYYKFNIEDISSNPNTLFYNHSSIKQVYDGTLSYTGGIVSSPTPYLGTGCLHIGKSATSYSATIKYYIGDMVDYNSNTHKCIVSDISNILPTDTNYWSLVKTGTGGLHSWARIPNISLQSSSFPISVCFWLYTVSPSNNAHIFNFSTTLTNSTRFFMLMYQGSGFATALYATTGTEFNTVMSSAVLYTPRTWEHYHLILYPGTKTFKFGKNGVLGSTFSFTTPTIPAEFNYPVCVLGKKTDNALDPNFTAFIDDFRVYASDLTQSELTSIYNNSV